MANPNKRITLAAIVLGFVAVSLPILSSRAQERWEGHIGLPQDWSTRHIIFTNGAPPEIAAAVARDPRSWIHWARRTAPLLYRRPSRGPELLHRPRRNMRVDWAVSLGPNGGMPIGETPAKYGFNTVGYSCAGDFVVYVIGATPSATQANILAFNNLYTGTASSSCPNGPQTPPTTNYTQPTFMWSYEVGTGAVNLSPVLSLDGTKVAFVESATHGMFDVLKWVSGQGTSATAPAVPGTGGSSAVRLDYTNTTVTGCTANAAANSDSSPYIDYGSDSAYVGANNGELYRISGVFNGTPAVQYCVTVNAGTNLTSPVYDSVTNSVFVSDGHSVYAYTPGPTGFTKVGSITVADAAVAGNPIILSPIVDSTNGFVYVFSSADATDAHTIVSQLNTALTTQTTVALGKPASQFILDGDFDNAYFNNGPKTGAGTLYACGTQSNNGAKPSLYALSFSAPNGLINTTPAVSDNRNINGASNPNGSCSPLLDFFDGTTDRLFVGTGNYTGTGGANLVTEWNVNTRIAANTTAPNNTAVNEWGGTSAFTIDNVSPDPQTTSIYFGTLQPPGGGSTSPCGTGNYCAVKLTQSALQ
ncbi:MAG TPA: hypothetical protein VEI26_06815 [Terriglobales bacterium]|nr:hypothetical protein [Terriglobales bacterium]